MLHSVQRFLQECQANSNFDIGETHKWTSASWTYLFTSVALVLFAGMCSGLTLGLLSLDLMELEVLKRSGSAKEQAYAERIIPLIKNTHYLLVTLLLSNAAAMEALPIFLDRLVDPLTAILVSVTAVLFFGEIIPQSICTRFGLAVGATLAPFVRLLMVLSFPLAWPIGKLLDHLLGSEHHTLFRRTQLKALVDLHRSDTGFGGKLTLDEARVIAGALDLTHKIAFKSMTSLDKVFMLSTDETLNDAVLDAIIETGHSRIPVFRGTERTDLVGLVMVKELMWHLRHAAKDVPVSSLNMRPMPRLSAATPMYDLLKLFQMGRSHMVALVQPYEADIQDVLDELAPERPTSSTSSSSAPSRASSIDLDRQRMVAMENVAVRASRAASVAGGSDVMPAVQARDHTELGQMLGQPPDLEAAHLLPDNVSHPKARTPLFQAMRSFMDPRTKSKSRTSKASRASDPHDDAASTSSSDSGHSRSYVPSDNAPLLEAIELLEDQLDNHKVVPGQPIGIITIEDVIEELLRVEIVDETDKYIDNEKSQLVGDAVREMTLNLPNRVKEALGMLKDTSVHIARRSRDIFRHPSAQPLGTAAADAPGGGEKRPLLTGTIPSSSSANDLVMLAPSSFKGGREVAATSTPMVRFAPMEITAAPSQSHSQTQLASPHTTDAGAEGPSLSRASLARSLASSSDPVRHKFVAGEPNLASHSHDRSKRGAHKARQSTVGHLAPTSAGLAGARIGVKSAALSRH